MANHVERLDDLVVQLESAIEEDDPSEIKATVVKIEKLCRDIREDLEDVPEIPDVDEED